MGKAWHSTRGTVHEDWPSDRRFMGQAVVIDVRLVQRHARSHPAYEDGRLDGHGTKTTNIKLDLGLSTAHGARLSR